MNLFCLFRQGVFPVATTVLYLIISVLSLNKQVNLQYISQHELF